MPFEIIWSPTARETFLNVLEYIESKWSLRESKQFTDHTEAILRSLQQFPRMHAYSIEADIYKCVITKQTSLFYRLNGDKIELLVFWDNRQDNLSGILPDAQ